MSDRINNFKNADDFNNFIVKESSDIIKSKKSDISEFLIALENGYLGNLYMEISPISLLLLQYITNYIKDLITPYYNNIIDSIITYHMSRIVNNYLTSTTPYSKLITNEPDTQRHFDIDD